jgi:hypothetical protein
MPHNGVVPIRLRILDSSRNVRFARQYLFKSIDDYWRLFRVDGNVCSSAQDAISAELTVEPSNTNVFVRQDAFGNVLHNVLVETDRPFFLLNRAASSSVELWMDPDAKEVAYVAPKFEAVADQERAMRRFGEATDLRRTVFASEFVDACPSADLEVPISTENAARIHMIQFTSNRVTLDVDTSFAGTLVLTDAYFPGWRATLNGKDAEVVQANGAFRAVCIPSPGRYRVIFTYTPRLLTSSLVLAATGIAMLLLLSVFSKGTSAPKLNSRRSWTLLRRPRSMRNTTCKQ